MEDRFNQIMLLLENMSNDMQDLKQGQARLEQRQEKLEEGQARLEQERLLMKNNVSLIFQVTNIMCAKQGTGFTRLHGRSAALEDLVNLNSLDITKLRLAKNNENVIIDHTRRYNSYIIRIIEKTEYLP